LIPTKARLKSIPAFAADLAQLPRAGCCLSKNRISFRERVLRALETRQKALLWTPSAWKVAKKQGFLSQADENSQKTRKKRDKTVQKALCFQRLV